MTDRNKIAQELTVEQLSDFIGQLAELPGKERTLAAIQEKAATLGITISLMSAKSFRDTTFTRYLDKLSKAQEKAMQVRGMQEAGAGNTLADAAGALLSEVIFDALSAEDAKDIDIKKYSLAIARMRQGDVRLRALELDVKEFERRERERAEKNAAAAAQLQKLRDPSAGLNETERTAILDEVDRLMGVK